MNSRILLLVLTLFFVFPIASSFAGETYKSKGTVNKVYIKEGKINLNMEAVPSLKWPPMTMDFDCGDTTALEKLKTGQQVEFDFAEKPKGRYAITKITPLK